MIECNKYKTLIEITQSHICSKLKEVEQEAAWSMRKFCEYHRRFSNLYRWVEDVIEETGGKLVEMGKGPLFDRGRERLPRHAEKIVEISTIVVS